LATTLKPVYLDFFCFTSSESKNCNFTTGSQLLNCRVLDAPNHMTQVVNLMLVPSVGIVRSLVVAVSECSTKLYLK